MKLLSLLKKEALWSRHRILTLLVLLLVFPALFASATVIFEDVIPRDMPIGIVAEDESVSDDEVDFILGGAETFSEPRVYDDKSAAMRDLRRESIYAVLQVPPGILDESTDDATFELYVHGGVVPFLEPSKAVRRVGEYVLNQKLSASVDVERTVVGDEKSLAEYLAPVFLMGIMLLFAFTYLPYNLAREAAVLDRLLVESSLEAVVTAKISFFTLLMTVPIVGFAAAAAAFEYSITLLSVGTVLAYLLTFVYLAAISTGVMILTKFDTFGRFLNVVVLFGALTFSSLVYPVGFFSPIRREIARQVPLHYSMIVARSTSLKDAPVGLFGDWLLGLVGFTVLAAAFLELSIVHYRRTT